MPGRKRQRSVQAAAEVKGKGESLRGACHVCSLTPVPLSDILNTTPSQQALDAKFAAIEEKDNDIHQLQLSLREKERDLDRLNNLLSHNEETINVSDDFRPENS